MEQIIQEIAEELQIPKSKVKAALYHMTNWLRHAMSNLKYAEIHIPKFGTFKVMAKRAPEELRENLEEYYNVKRKNRKNEKEEHFKGKS